MIRRCRPGGREQGQAALAYIGAILTVGIVVATTTIAVAHEQEHANQRAQCAATELVTAGQEECPSGPAGSPGDPDDPGGDSGPPGQRPSSCTDVIYADSDGSRQVRVNCVWYPIPPTCSELSNIPNWQPGLTAPAGNGETVQQLADCVTAGTGPPSVNPDDITCTAATPMTGVVTAEPPTAQVGCTAWIVPKECAEQWTSFQGLAEDAAPGDRQRASDALAKCINDFYKANEVDCIVKSETTTSRVEIKVLFFLKIEKNQGLLVEQLGDGRWRVHALDGVKVGADINLPEGTKGIDFNLLAMAGWASDDTYEFPDQASTEKWVEWYKDWKAGYNESDCVLGFCPGGESKDELLTKEPPRRKHSEAESKSLTVGVKGGWSPGGNGAGISGGWEGEGTRETRELVNGQHVTTLTMSDEGGVALLGKLGKKRGQDKDGKDQPGTQSGALKDSLGVEVKGKTSFTVVWNADGTPAKIILGVDDTMLGTLAKVNPEVQVKLPGGFSVGADFLYQRKEGTSTIRENVIDFGTHPELVGDIMPLLDELFPRNDDGDFKNDAPKLDFDTGGIGDLTDNYGTTRNLKYDVTQEEIMGGGGVYFGGLPLIEVKGGKLTEGRDLTGSSLEVIDVNGDKRKQDPSPKCKDKQVDPATYKFDAGPPFADRD
jgi:hypothetical protein